MPHISNTAFELDNGHMIDHQLEKKLFKHYANIDGQVVFIMGHRELPHLKVERLTEVFNITSQLFYSKANKVLGA